MNLTSIIESITNPWTNSNGETMYQMNKAELNKLVEAIEDALDLQDLREAMVDSSGGFVSHEDVMKELGL